MAAIASASAECGTTKRPAPRNSRLNSSGATMASSPAACVPADGKRPATETATRRPPFSDAVNVAVAAVLRERPSMPSAA
jgi:hypothetical protein